MSNSSVRTGRSGFALSLTLRKAAGAISVVSGILLSFSTPTEAQVVAGPAYSEFRLTLDQGKRKEAVGPLYYEEEQEDTIQWAFPPLMSYTHDHVLPSTEFDIL